jgi:hypothetical protein
VGFVADKVAPGQVFSEFFGFPLSIPFRRRSSYSYIIRGMNNMSVVRFQVLTAASMNFRIVFCDVLPLIPDDVGSTYL